MIRKTIIVVLTLGMIGTAAMIIVSYLGHVRLGYWIKDQATWCAFTSSHGRFFVWCHSDVLSLSKEEGPGVYRCRLGDDLLYLVLPWGDLTTYRNYGWKTPRVRYHEASSWKFGIVAVVFGAYPTLAFLHGPVRGWSRRKRGRCVKCGYDLTGLTEPRCPECGREVESP